MKKFKRIGAFLTAAVLSVTSLAVGAIVTPEKEVSASEETVYYDTLYSAESEIASSLITPDASGWNIDTKDMDMLGVAITTQSQWYVNIQETTGWTYLDKSAEYGKLGYEAIWWADVSSFDGAYVPKEGDAVAGNVSFITKSKTGIAKRTYLTTVTDIDSDPRTIGTDGIDAIVIDARNTASGGCGFSWYLTDSERTVIYSNVATGWINPGDSQKFIYTLDELGVTPGTDVVFSSYGGGDKWGYKAEGIELDVYARKDYTYLKGAVTYVMNTTPTIEGADVIKKFESSDTSVVTVSDTGAVTPVKAGTAKITLTYKNDKKTSLDVTVKTLELASTAASIKIGKTAQISVKDTSTAAKTYTSKKTSVATVSATGLVTAVAAGTADIEVVDKDGNTATFTVTVSDKDVVNFVEDSKTIVMPATTYQIEVTDADIVKANTWASSDEAVATVDQTGKVTIKSVGTANITVTSTDDVVSTFVLTVENPAAVALDKTSITMKTDGVEDITVTAGDVVEWKVGSTDVATVQKTESGVTVTAVAAGTTTVTAIDAVGRETVVEVVVEAYEVGYGEVDLYIGSNAIGSVETTGKGEYTISYSGDGITVSEWDTIYIKQAGSGTYAGLGAQLKSIVINGTEYAAPKAWSYSNSSAITEGGTFDLSFYNQWAPDASFNIGDGTGLDLKNVAITSIKIVFVLGAPDVIVEVNEDDDVTSVAIDSAMSDIKNALLTEEELQLIEKGATAAITLNVVDAEETIDADAKEVLDSFLKDNSLIAAAILDCTLTVKVGDGEERTVSEFASAITLTFRIPSDLPEVAKGYVREYGLVQIHDGEMISLTPSVDVAKMTISAKVDKNSYFILTYKDVKATPEDGDVDGGDSITVLPIVLAAAAAVFATVAIVGKKEEELQ